ncbi:MAG TPA: hypothetical protein VKA46_15760 [Gemmataceae bacterium]|nr:hypothetical protein [Gemmataceae bacterium]
MATTIAISCPKCENQIKAPAELAGKKIRCKECQHVFVVKSPPAAKPADKTDKTGKGDKAGKGAKDKEADKAGKGAKDKETDKAKKEANGTGDDDANPYGVTDHDFLPRCPFCAKELQSEDQVICLNCGYNRRTRERHRAKKTYETSGNEQFLWLLPGILCAIGVLIMLGSIIVFWTLFPGWESDNKEAWWSFAVGLPGRIWGSVICLFIGFFLGLFAVKRLILNPTRPEVEKVK